MKIQGVKFAGGGCKISINCGFVVGEKRRKCMLLQENIKFLTVETDSISSSTWHPGNKRRVSLKPNNLEC